MGFEGLQVLSLESRRAKEMAELIRKQGGEGFVAPSMREAPLESNDEALAAGERLLGGEFDTVIFLTGVGTRAFERLLATRHPPERLREALLSTTVVARGPKPVAALREMDVPVDVRAPEPNTWRELIQSLEGRKLGKVAIQEYGRSNPKLLEALRERAEEVVTIRIYAWDLPEDTGPLREAVRGLAAKRFDVAMFTTPNQVVHLFRIADEEDVTQQLLEAVRGTMIASIGPSTTEMLGDYGIVADMEPSHPKMGLLVAEAAEQAPELLRRKRAA